jgi:hypothetical protein
VLHRFTFFNPGCFRKRFCSRVRFFRLGRNVPTG